MICSNHTQILSYAFVCLASHGHADDIWARQASSPRRALFVYTNTPHQMTSLLHRGLLQSRLDCTLGKKRAGAGKREKITLSPCFRFLSPALPSPFFLSQEPLRRRESGDPWPKGKAITNHEGDNIPPLSDLSSLLKYNLCQGKIKWGPEELNLNV